MSPSTTERPWLVDPVNECVQYLADEIMYASLVERGVRILSVSEPVVRAAKLHVKSQGVESKYLASFETLENEARMAEPHAKRVLNDNFRRLYRHSAVGMWAAIETMIDQMIIGAMKNIDDYKNRIANTHPSLAGSNWFKRSSSTLEEERRKYEGTLSNDFPNVVDRYVELLRPFGVTINLQSETRSLLTEMSEMRNIVLHKGAVVDDRFLQKCPWTNLSTGDEYIITHEGIHKFHEGCSNFVLEILGNLKTPKMES